MSNNFCFGNTGINLSEKEYSIIRQFIKNCSGIELGDTKQALVVSRLSKRVMDLGLSSYSELVDFITSAAGAAEKQNIINLLTTNESYFFREVAHFSYLIKHIQSTPISNRPLRIWCAASSSGEEIYSLSMELTEKCNHRAWEILGSDISTKVLDQATAGLYPEARTKNIPEMYLKKYCLRGTGTYSGMVLIDKALRNRVNFKQINLIGKIPDMGTFDVIFLRNVLIYFDQSTILDVVSKLARCLNDEGLFFVGHSESIKDLLPEIIYKAPAIYQKKIRE